MALNATFTYVSPVYTSQINRLAATLYADWQNGAATDTTLADYQSLAQPIVARFGAGTYANFQVQQNAFATDLNNAGGNTNAQYQAIEKAVASLEVSVARQGVLNNVAFVLHSERLTDATEPTANIAASDLGRAIAGPVAGAGISSATIAQAATTIVNGISGSFPGFGEINYAAGLTFDTVLAGPLLAADESAFTRDYPNPNLPSLSPAEAQLAQAFTDAGLAGASPFGRIVALLQSSTQLFEQASRAEARDPALIAAVNDPSTTGAEKEHAIGAALLQLSQTIAGAGYGVPQLTAATIGAGAVYLLRHDGAFPAHPPIQGIANNAFQLLQAERHAAG